MDSLFYWAMAWRKGVMELLKTAHHVSLILKDLPSRNEFPQWNLGEGWQNKISLHSPSMPQGKLNQIYIFEVPSLKKKKTHQHLMGFIYPQEH